MQTYKEQFAMMKPKDVFSSEMDWEIREAAECPDVLYHLTPLKNVGRIKREGLKADDEGNIFAFTHAIVADVIANDQVFVNRYGVFYIDLHAVGEGEVDEVSEWTHPWQRILKLPHILKEHLKYLGRFRTPTWGPTAFRCWHNRVARGLSLQQSLAEWEYIMSEIERQKRATQ